VESTKEVYPGKFYFIVFINDIVDLFGRTDRRNLKSISMVHLKVKLYADDVKMYTVIHDVSTSKWTQ